MRRAKSESSIVSGVLRPATFAAALQLSFVSAPLLGAQTTSSVAAIQSGASNQTVCLNFVDLFPGASSATCPVTSVFGGFASASTSINPASFTATAKAQLQQTGSTGNAFVNATGTWGFFIDVLGDKTHFGDTLVVHVATTVDELFGGGLGSSHDSFVLAFMGTGTGSWRRFLYPDGTSEVRLFGGTAITPTGLDLFIPFSFVGGTQAFGLSFFARDVLVGDQPAGATMSASLDLRLNGAELVSFGGNRQPVAFDSNGRGTLVGTAFTAPEPSSVVLMTTGLICLGVATRKRRVRSRMWH